MDERVEAFLVDILALEGEEANAIRQGVRSVRCARKWLISPIHYPRVFFDFV